MYSFQKLDNQGEGQFQQNNVCQRKIYRKKGRAKGV